MSNLTRKLTANLSRRAENQKYRRDVEDAYAANEQLRRTGRLPSFERQKGATRVKSPEGVYLLVNTGGHKKRPDRRPIVQENILPNDPEAV